MKDILFIALILACPVAMAWMMSRGHGHGSAAGSHAVHEHPSELSTDELRRQRAELDRVIAARELSDAPAEDE